MSLFGLRVTYLQLEFVIVVCYYDLLYYICSDYMHTNFVTTLCDVYTMCGIEVQHTKMLW